MHIDAPVEFRIEQLSKLITQTIHTIYNKPMESITAWELTTKMYGGFYQDMSGLLNRIEDTISWDTIEQVICQAELTATVQLQKPHALILTLRTNRNM